MKPFVLGNTVTVMSPDGQPIQVNSNMLQTAAAQTAAGTFFNLKLTIHPERNVNNDQKEIKIILDLNLTHCLEK